MKSFFKHMVDSAVVFVAEKYGFGDEEDMLKNEIRTLQYDYMLEKTKNMDDAIHEVKTLQEEVKKLTQEKVYLLEKQVARLEHENKQYKLLGTNNALQLDGANFPFNEIERFSFMDDYIKCVFNNGSTKVYPLRERELLDHLLSKFADVMPSIQGEHLQITYLEEGNYKSARFELNEFVSIAEIEQLNQISYMAKRTIY